jgi:hypothetical protein
MPEPITVELVRRQPPIVMRAAQHLAMPRQTFVAKMDMYQIAHPKAER